MKYLTSLTALLMLAVLQCACVQKDGSGDAQNVALLQRIYSEVFNQGKIQTLDEVLSPGVVEHEEFPGLGSGFEGVKQFFIMFRRAFPDVHVQVDDIFAAGDKVVARITIHGTQNGQFLDMPPSGKKISVQGYDIVRVANGKIVEHWGLADTMTMMQQLGAIPAPQQAQR